MQVVNSQFALGTEWWEGKLHLLRDRFDLWLCVRLGVKSTEQSLCLCDQLLSLQLGSKLSVLF